MSMTAEQAHAELEALGTAQNRKVYARHGVGGAMYGVSYANLGKLAKEIRVDHALAKALWASGNHDARVLAARVADPAEMSLAALDAWARDLDNYTVTEALVGLASRTPHARRKFEVWSKSKREWVATAGWGLLSYLARVDPTVGDDFLEAQLETIEAEIHDRPNRVRYTMNMALIAIGGSREALRDKAVAAARRIGKVEVDHGETGCKTPVAIPYIEKMWARRKQRRQRR